MKKEYSCIAIVTRLSLLLTLVAFSGALSLLSAQEFQFRPDRFIERLDASTLVDNPAPGTTSTYYEDPMPYVQHDWWNEMQSNSNWNTLYTFKDVNNIVRVAIDHENNRITSDFRYRIFLRVKGYNNPVNPTSIAGEEDFEVLLEYKNDSLVSYQDQVSYKLKGSYHAMDVYVTGIVDANTNNPVNRVNLARNFVITGEIAAQRHVTQAMSIFINSQYQSATKELLVRWQHFNPATQSFNCAYLPSGDDYKQVKYELEWLYVDNYRVSNFVTGNKLTKFTSGSFSFPYDFRNNATRIQTYNPEYRIPVTYEGGVIVFRIRSVRPDPANYGTYIYSDWNLNATGTMSNGAFSSGSSSSPFQCVTKCLYFIDNPFEDDKFNWQYSISFAEEGKYKHVLNYFDGAGNSRQTQTKLNTDPDYVITADKIYDYEGRAAIQSLPIPVLSQDLTYKDGLLKQKTSLSQYKAADFDVAGDPCGIDSISPVLESSLAAQYYSEDNPDKAGMQKFVPDAKGYPFVETIFSSDNTGKVLWHGGAGPDFQRWNGHGTRNRYVRADQYELNRLMGTEAGRAQYYPKQVTTDPNGQSSFSVVNSSGQVVATALVGDPPDNNKIPIKPLDNLPSPQTATFDVLSNVLQTVEDGKRTAEYNFFVESNGINTLKYEASIPPYNPGCNSEYINVQGFYKYNLVSDCGTEEAAHSGTVGSSGITGSSAAQRISGAPSTTASLEPEKHTISKELYFPDTSMRRLAAEFTDSHTGFGECYIYRDSFVRNSVDASTFPCAPGDTIGSCETKRKQMISELYPKAKYGAYFSNSANQFVYGYSNSIFSFLGYNPGIGSPPFPPVSCMYIIHCYRNDYPPNNTVCANEPPVVFWPQETVTRDTIWSATPPDPCTLGAGCWYTGPFNCVGYEYRYQADCISLPNVTIPDGNGGTTTVNASTLGPQALIDNFNEEIAEALLPLHPEYCKLLLCDDDFEQKLSYINNYVTAEVFGLHTLAGLLANDPLNSAVNINGPFSPNDLSHFAFDGNVVLAGSNGNLLRRIDSMSLEQAYCNCISPEAYMYCKNQQYAYEIATGTMTDEATRDLFFMKLRANYLGNRNYRKQMIWDSMATCNPCPDERMELMIPAVFPQLTDGSGNIANMNGLPSWAQDIMQQGIDGYQFSSVPAEVAAEIAAGQENNCRTQVQRIMDGLASCGMSTLDSTDVSEYLIDNFCTAGSNGANITPYDVATALSTNGISQDDLCSAFLAEYGLFNERKLQDRSRYVNRRSAFYSGLQTFLNRDEVRNALATAAPSGGTSYGSFILNTGANEYEAALSSALNGATSTDIRGYTISVTEGVFSHTYPCLVIQGGGIYDTIYFARRNMTVTPPSCGNSYGSPVDFVGASYTNITFSQVRSGLDEPGMTVLPDGLVASNMAFVNLEGLVSASTACDNYAIWSYRVPMLKLRDPEALDHSINCAQIKGMVEDYYADATTFNLPIYANHPLFPTAFANYVNFRLNKSHTFDEYQRLMAGCAVSDRLEVPRLRATYELRYGAELDASNFMAGLRNAFPDLQITQTMFHRPGITVGVWVDLNSVPRKRLRAVKNYIDINGGINFTYQQTAVGNALAELYIRAGSCSNPFSGIPNVSVSSELNHLKDANNDWVEYDRYTLLFSGSGHLALANALAAVEAYINNPANGCDYGPVLYRWELYRSPDYADPVKQDYLNYVYSLSGSPEDVSDALSPAALTGAALIAADLITYQDTWCNNVKEDLYYYTYPGVYHTGFARLNQMLHQVRTDLAGPLFSTQASLTVSPGPLGTSLKAFSMGDGGAWYRLFDGQNRLYNVYLYPSKDIVGKAHEYEVASGSDVVTIIPGADSIYRFRVRMQKAIGINTHTVEFEGYCDFSLGHGNVVRNVVLHDHQNKRGCLDTLNCERRVLNAAIEQAHIRYVRYIDSVKEAHFLAMKRHFPQQTKDTLWLTTEKRQHHYTLYYYDRAGNLTRTVPPAGVTPLSGGTLNSIDGIRESGGTTNAASHNKISRYYYNTMNQLTRQETPDGGVSYFFYDLAGRLVFSQNAKQQPYRRYSYTLYDDKGRVSETGAIAFDPSEYAPGSSHPNLVANAHTQNLTTFLPQIWGKPRLDVVSTIYDNALLDLSTHAGQSDQENLRARVSSILYAPMLAQGDTIYSYYTYASHFSYDALGNVSTLVHDNPYLDYLGQRFKRIDYDYDLMSGKVNMLSYNRGRADQFYHRYDYDADNRLTAALSSKDGIQWDRDAAYEYYKHGPLAQTHIGELKVQSVQYAYTIQGWLKAINGDVLRPEDDMGQDGLGGGGYPADAFAHALDYHAGDYKPIGSTLATHTQTTAPMTRSLYNGNIARQATALAGMENLQRNYTYDQLNRLDSTSYMRISNDISRAVQSMANANAYASRYRYDADGNFTNLMRRNGSGTIIDNFTYNYSIGNNRLHQVVDAAANTGGGDLSTGQAANNYAYDPTGNLVKDVQGNIDNITWNLYGKVSDMDMAAGDKSIHYEYDGAGNRVRKDMIEMDNGVGIRNTDVYVRDAQGNILAVYKGRSYIDDGFIDWVNDDIINQHGTWTSSMGVGFSAFINNFYANNGQFSVPLINYAITNSPTWSNSQSAGASLYDYLQYADGIYNQATHYYVDEYIPEMAANDVGILTSAFSANENQEFVPLFDNILHNGGTRVVRNTFQFMCEEVPDLAIAMMALESVDISTVGTTERVYIMETYATTVSSENLVAGLSQLIKDYDMSIFYERLMQDDETFANGTWLKGSIDIVNSLGDILYSHAPRSDAASFFKDFLPGRDPSWLANHSSLDERLHAVYRMDRNGFLEAYIGTVGIQGVNSSLKSIATLTNSNYLNNVQVAVFTNTLSPGYNPPDVNTPRPGDNLLGDTLYLAEHHLYGSSRLGIATYDSTQYRSVWGPAVGPTPAGLRDSSLNTRVAWLSQGHQTWIRQDRAQVMTGSTLNRYADTIMELHKLGRKLYEFTDHLGNTLAITLDKKKGFGNDGGYYVGYYPELLALNDYYPFGMLMPDRNPAAGNGYRFGFNGQEKTDEVYGKGNLNTALFWEYDTRIARRWNVDPVDQISISNYAVNSLNPITNNDPDGDCDRCKESAFIAPEMATVETNDDRTVTNYFWAAENGLRDAVNILPYTWNSFVHLAYSIYDGNVINDLKADVNAIKMGVESAKTYVKEATVQRIVSDATSPKAIRGLTTLVGTSFIGSGVASLRIPPIINTSVPNVNVGLGKGFGATKGVTNGLSKTISAQKQARHIAGTAKPGGGFLNSVDDAQSVLNAVHSGKATFLGTSKAGHQVYRFNGVTGTNVNVGAGITGQPTNVFMIKGTTSPSVVPTSPLWKP